MKSIQEWYIRYPIPFDIALVILIWYVSRFNILNFELTSMEAQLNIMSSIISTDVSLAGFILAALTIIVTFRSNLKAKDMDQATDALELILSSGHYKDIKGVFKVAIKEFLLIFIVLYFLWNSSANFSVYSLTIFNACGILLTGIVVIRTLTILFGVIDLDETKFDE
jgi:glycerol uptake facilitator-like aquaporin